MSKKEDLKLYRKRTPSGMLLDFSVKERRNYFLSTLNESIAVKSPSIKQVEKVLKDSQVKSAKWSKSLRKRLALSPVKPIKRYLVSHKDKACKSSQSVNAVDLREINIDESGSDSEVFQTPPNTPLRPGAP